MPRKAPAIVITELRQKAEMEAIFPLIRQLNPEMTKAEFKQALSEMLPLGYRCVAATQGKKLIGAMGFWTGRRFWCGKYMELDNVVVDQNQRSAGVGALMQAWAEKEARRLGCHMIWLLSYSHNHASHRFYLRERYIIKGFGFAKELT